MVSPIHTTDVTVPARRSPGSVPAAQPQTESAFSPPPAAMPKRRVAPVFNRWLAILAVPALLGLGGYALMHELGKTSSTPDIQLFKVTRRSFPVIFQEKGELKAAHITDVRCELEGKSTIIFLVPEGSHVKKGDLIVELASDEIDDKIREAEIKVATTKAAYEAAQKELQITRDKNASDVSKADLAVWVAQHTLEKYEKGEAIQLRQTDKLGLEKAEYVLRRDQDKLKDSEELYKKGFITRLELENDRFQKVQDEMELAKAQTALKVTEEYTIPIALQEKKSAVVEAQKELERTKSSAQASEAKGMADVDAKQRDFKLTEDKLKKLKDQKVKAKVYAPTDGLVVYVREDWDDQPRIKAGAQVVEHERMIELPDTSTMKVSLRVHEAKIERIRKGLTATVEIEGFTGRQFTGQVSDIAVLADARHWFNRLNKEYETSVLLDGVFTELKPGVTARAQILVTELKDVLAVPVQAVFGKGSKYFVFVDTDGRTEPVEVKVGLSSTDFVEIKEGLTEGVNVRMAVTEQMRAQLPQDQGNEQADEEERRPHRLPMSQPAVELPAASQPAGAPAPATSPVAPTTRPAVSTRPGT